MCTQKKVGALPVKGYEEEKQSNEIRFFIPTVGQIDLSGRMVSADAMNTQVKIVEYLIQQGADYHLTVKGNQPTLLEDVSDWYELSARKRTPDFSEAPEKGHGRITRRQIWITDSLNDHVRFPHVGLAFAVKRQVHYIRGKKPDTVEIAFGVTSVDKDSTTAEEVLRTNRKHWSVEAAHNVLDNRNGFDEDACKVRSGHAPENLACMRRFALTVLRHCQKVNDRPITDQLQRLGLKPRRVIDMLRLTGNTRGRTRRKSCKLRWLPAA
ncbi:MAG: ISAs1 family transposase [Gemmatimonadota bacterium]|nr:ISAs1 family transposase [Gemmatimonadota bacterium]